MTIHTNKDHRIDPETEIEMVMMISNMIEEATEIESDRQKTKGIMKMIVVLMTKTNVDRIRMVENIRMMSGVLPPKMIELIWMIDGRVHHMTIVVS